MSMKAEERWHRLTQSAYGTHHRAGKRGRPRAREVQREAQRPDSLRPSLGQLSEMSGRPSAAGQLIMEEARGRRGAPPPRNGVVPSTSREGPRRTLDTSVPVACHLEGELLRDEDVFELPEDEYGTAIQQAAKDGDFAKFEGLLKSQRNTTRRISGWRRILKKLLEHCGCVPAARNVGRCINTRHTGTCAAQAALDSLNPTTLRALSNYEIFHGLLAGIASVGEVARSCAGVHGWAAWVPLQLKLAFAMGTHARLGAGAVEGQGCPYLMMPADLLERVVEVWVAESSGGSTAALKKKRVEVIRAALYASREERISREERMTRD